MFVMKRQYEMLSTNHCVNAFAKNSWRIGVRLWQKIVWFFLFLNSEDIKFCK